MTIASAPALIALDWGTSSLRAALLAADGRIMERIARPWGIRQLPPGGFAAAFTGVVARWHAQWPEVPIIAAGMVGSRQGWHEVPYVECPADVAVIARGLVPFETGQGRMWIVPGVIQRGPLPNVLRGEEAQLVGAVASEPALAEKSLVVLPGTHGKWVFVERGRIVRFETFMTGELFAVLRDHSLLGVPAREAAGGPADDAERTAAFRQGVVVARESGAAGVAGRLFSARSLVLTGDLPAARTLDYLSGLLVGEEVRSAIVGLGGDLRLPIVIGGDAGLDDRYRLAFDLFGIEAVRSVGDPAIFGLCVIARTAGLVGAEEPLHES